MKCRDCAFWTDGDRPRLPLGWKVCRKMDADGMVPLDVTTLAFAFETGEQTSRVATAPDFGCVMFQEKVKP